MINHNIEKNSDTGSYGRIMAPSSNAISIYVKKVLYKYGNQHR